ncbi:MAG: hypothetical protein PUA87_10205 [Oscillospiraceae bacterium]|nr:hypothetical protein [Oscillospiraceae bacterium]
MTWYPPLTPCQNQLFVTNMPEAGQTTTGAIIARAQFVILSSGTAIGNCHRGYLYKTQPKTRQPSFIYGFNAQGELVTTESESCGKEFILYTDHATVGISFVASEQFGLRIETVSLCEYNEAGQILLYLVASCPVDDPLLMRQCELELYHYGSEGLETADWYYLLHHDSLYVSHNIFTFQHNADGELSSYTVETRYGIDDVPHKSAFPDHVYEVYVKRKV